MVDEKLDQLARRFLTSDDDEDEYELASYLIKTNSSVMIGNHRWIGLPEGKDCILKHACGDQDKCSWRKIEFHKH
jgi:hypothetical protein